MEDHSCSVARYIKRCRVQGEGQRHHWRKLWKKEHVAKCPNLSHNIHLLLARSFRIHQSFPIRSRSTLNYVTNKCSSFHHCTLYYSLICRKLRLCLFIDFNPQQTKIRGSLNPPNVTIKECLT